MLNCCCVLIEIKIHTFYCFLFTFHVKVFACKKWHIRNYNLFVNRFIQKLRSKNITSPWKCHASALLWNNACVVFRLTSGDYLHQEHLQHHRSQKCVADLWRMGRGKGEALGYRLPLSSVVRWKTAEVSQWFSVRPWYQINHGNKYISSDIPHTVVWLPIIPINILLYLQNT